MAFLFKSNSKKSKDESCGPYILGKTIGRGKTSKVKIAYHKETNEKYAVKVIKKKYFNSHKKNILREVMAMRLLDHPDIVKVYDVFDSSEHVFIVQEFVSGGEVFDYVLKKGKLFATEALRLFGQIVRGVEFCHMHSICHRDLKLENIFLDKNMNAKIGDFGMAQVSNGEKFLKSFCGSPHYAAPELVSGTPYDGRCSDVWSLGVILYAMITGMLPFDDDNMGDLLKQVKKGKYEMPSWVPKDVADLISKMMTKNVKKRIKTGDIKFHPCWKLRESSNTFFPLERFQSPVFKMLKLQPVKNEKDLDMDILEDLEALGWGKLDKLKEKMLESKDEGVERKNLNLVEVFYMLLLHRNKYKGDSHRFGLLKVGKERKSQVRHSVSLPSSPMRSSSHRTKEVTINSRGSEDSVPALMKDDFTLDEQKKPRKHLELRITVDDKNREEKFDKLSRESSQHYRIREISGESDPESPAGPITPTEKISWFQKLFSRVPSAAVKKEKNQGTSGIYSEKKPEEFLSAILKIIDGMGIQAEKVSEFKVHCQCTTYVDDMGKLVVCDKSGDKTLFKASDSKEEFQVSKSEVDEAFKEKQEIKFTIEVGSESENVSNLTLLHVSGNLLMYNILHLEMVEKIASTYY